MHFLPAVSFFPLSFSLFRFARIPPLFILLFPLFLSLPEVQNSPPHALGCGNPPSSPLPYVVFFVII